MQITSKPDSDFKLVVQDIERDTLRVIDAPYIVGRKPMIYGQSKNIRTYIANMSSKGFAINTLSLEGNFNIRSKRK